MSNKKQEFLDKVDKLFSDIIEEFHGPEDIIGESGLLKQIAQHIVIETLRAKNAGKFKFNEDESSRNARIYSCDLPPEQNEFTRKYNLAEAASSIQYHKIDLETWESEWGTGKWEYLNGLSELAHYAVIAGYVRKLKPNCRLLDVGCGEGTLNDQLEGSLLYYLGLDISAAAITLAKQRRGTRGEYIVADANLYVPNQTFDVIVFNECIYYLPNPLDTLRSYSNYLAKNGLIVVSTFVGEVPIRIWEEIHKVYNILDQVRLTNGDGSQWVVKILTF